MTDPRFVQQFIEIKRLKRSKTKSPCRMVNSSPSIRRGLLSHYNSDQICSPIHEPPNLSFHSIFSPFSCSNAL